MEFQSKKKGLKEEYLDFISHVFRNDEYTYWTYNRKYYRHFTWVVNDFFGGAYDLDYLGYTKSKMTSLMKTYAKPELLEMGRDILIQQKDKGYISSSFSFITGNKSKKKKSYCMNSAVFTQDANRKAKRDLTIFYRATQIPKRFGADLLFLKQIFKEYIPEELREGMEVRFYFTLMYVVPIYYPLIYTMGIRVNKRGQMAEACRHQLDRADDLSIIPKYGPTKKAYEFYRKWRKKNENR